MVFEITPVTSPLAYDCGATCMKMLLSYYGIDVDLQDLIKDCGTTMMGCTCGDLLRCGRKYGLDMRAFAENDNGDSGNGENPKYCEILKQDRPAIIWWLYRHWCVYGGVDDDGKVVIYNPDRGCYKVSKGTFKSFFTDVSLCNGYPEELPE